MSAARFNEDLTPLTPGDRVSAALTAARFNAMGKLAQEAAMGAHVRGGPGVRVRSGPQGTTISLSRRHRRMGGVVIHPFYIHEAGDYEGMIHAGTVRGEIPTLGGDPIGEDGDALSLSGSFWVYVKATFDLVFGAHFFLTSAEFITDADPLVIHTSETPVSDVFDAIEDTLTAYRLIAHVVDGAVMRQQPTTTSLSLNVCDAGDGTEEGRGAHATWIPT